MPGSRNSLLAAGCLVVVALAATSFAGIDVARGAPGGSGGSGGSGSSPTAAERSALLDLYAAESALARAEANASVARRNAAVTADREARFTRHLTILRQAHKATQRRVAALLRAMYIEGGQTDAVAIILGASSLTAALDEIDTRRRDAAISQRLGEEAARRTAELRTSLADARAAAAAAATAARTAETAIASASQTLAARDAELRRIREHKVVGTERVAVVQTEAARAASRNAELTTRSEASAPTEATPTPALSPPAPASGTRKLTVDAVAYHLPGRTASGLPVGMGVIAVDPAVIPLGTRVFVPGYGPAVAADTGSAIKGLIIDLWMPTTAQARAWGRRTVTITIYG
ncbi:MAG: 3D domain-containing protein [Gaiellales bacterium]